MTFCLHNSDANSKIQMKDEKVISDFNSSSL